MSSTTPKKTDFFHQDDETISNNLIQALRNKDRPDEITRRVLSVPVKNGGLAISQPGDYSKNYSDSQNLSEALDDASSDLIILEHDRMKKKIRKERLKTTTQKQNQTIGATNPDLSHDLKFARENGASWLNALPIEKHGLWLTKSEFRDALRIRYGWDFKNIPSTCACGSSIVLSHALHCPKGGYLSIRHSEIRRQLISPLIWWRMLATTRRNRTTFAACRQRDFYKLYLHRRWSMTRHLRQRNLGQSF